MTVDSGAPIPKIPDPQSRYANTVEVWRLQAAKRSSGSQNAPRS